MGCIKLRTGFDESWMMKIHFSYQINKVDLYFAAFEDNWQIEIKSEIGTCITIITE